METLVKMLYADEHLEIEKRDDGVWLRVLSPGMSLEDFDRLLVENVPCIRVTGFMPLKNALKQASGQEVRIAEMKERFALRVSEDGLTAWLTVSPEPDELSPERRRLLLRDLLGHLRNKGIHYGIRTERLDESMPIGHEFVVAVGDPPKQGKDAVVTELPMHVPKPTIIEDGHANFYDMNLITPIEQEQELGERTDPTPGTPGTSVYGQEIPAKPGANVPLDYDPVSVREVRDGNTTRLIAKKSGALQYVNGTIGVFDCMQIDGDVDFTHGDIHFNGSVIIKGTIHNGFSVVATGDIEINSPLGIGAVARIVSTDGSIVIKGGVAGQGKAEIRADKDVFVKFVSEAEVHCDGTARIGFYAMNSIIHARRIEVESPVGRLVGGSLHVQYGLETAELGNRSGTRTIVKVEGFSRSQLEEELAEHQHTLDALRNRVNAMKRENRSPKDADEEALRVKRLQDRIQTDLHEREYRVKQMGVWLKTPADGAVVVRKRLYGNVRIEIGHAACEVGTESPGVTIVRNHDDIVMK